MVNARWLLAAGIGSCLVTTGCVERVIRDFPEEDTLCGGVEECGPDQICVENVCVGKGAVRFTLSWSVVTDFDLHVFVPNGQWIDFENPDVGYGELDVDDCVAGECLDPSGIHVENVFLDDNAPRGRYGVQVVNFDGRAAADYTIEVAGDISGSFSGSLPAQELVAGPIHEIVW